MGSESIKFFDQHRVLYPWPQLLRRAGLSFLIKTREVFWRRELGRLGLKEGMRVLSVGCGRGEVLDRIAVEYGLQPTGVDISSASVREARQRTASKGLFFEGSAEKLPFGEAEFDLVVSFDTLEHVADQENAVLEMARVVKKGGRVVVWTVSANQRFTPNWWLGLIGINMYSPFDHQKERLVEPKRLQKWFKSAGLKPDSLKLANSFWTLLVDEAQMVLVAIWGRLFGWKNERLGGLVLGLATKFNQLVEPFLRLLEWPWRMLGLSNGVWLVGEKR